MNLDQVNKWLTLVANVGVVVGIVLVAVQLHENAEATRVQSEYALTGAVQSAEIACIGDTLSEAMITAVLKPSELTEAQVYQVWCYLDVAISAAQYTWLAYRDGHASQETWDNAKQQLVDYMDFDIGRIIWNHLKSKSEFSSLAVDEIDKALALGNGQEELLRGIMIDVRERGRAAPKSQTGDLDPRGTTPQPQ
jgi:hypothetical protein